MIDNNYPDEDHSVSEESFISVPDNNNYGEIYDNDDTVSEPEESGEGEDDGYDDDDDDYYDEEDNQSDEFDEEEYSEDEGEDQDIGMEGSLDAVINSRRPDEQDTMSGTIGLYPRTYTNGPIDYDVHNTPNVDDYLDVMSSSQSIPQERQQNFIDALRVFVDWSSEIDEHYEIGSEIHEEENEGEHIEFTEPIDALLGPDDEV